MSDASVPDTSLEAGRKELVGLTALRGWLAWWVVLFHISGSITGLFPALAPIAPMWSCGDAAVDMFFVLSGFVITLTNDKRLARFAWVGYRRFLVARLARVYPVHMVQQVAWLLLALVAVARGVHGFDADSVRATDFIRNAVLVQAWGVPMQMYWNYPAWSVSLEWLAYLSAPLILFATRGRGMRFSLVAALALWGGLLLARGSSVEHFARILFEFSIGSVVARQYVGGSRFGWARKAVLPLGLATLFAAATLHPTVVGYVAALPLMVSFIYVVACVERPLFGLGGRASRYMGQISYSIYMTHALSITVLHQVLHPSYYEAQGVVLRTLVLLAYLVVIFVVGSASYHLVEKPGQRWIAARVG